MVGPKADGQLHSKWAVRGKADGEFSLQRYQTNPESWHKLNLGFESLVDWGSFGSASSNLRWGCILNLFWVQLLINKYILIIRWPYWYLLVVQLFQYISSGNLLIPDLVWMTPEGVWLVDVDDEGRDTLVHAKTQYSTFYSYSYLTVCRLSDDKILERNSWIQDHYHYQHFYI